MKEASRALSQWVKKNGQSSLVSNGARRLLNLHEYQSKALMREFDVAAQKGWVAETPGQAANAVKQMNAEGISNIVMKAQVFAGGRGKGHLTSGLKGGVQFLSTPSAAEALAKKMLGYNLITHQTTAEGEVVRKLLLHEAVNIDREFYLAIVLDRSKGGPVFIASREGGIDIEEVANSNPTALLTEGVDVLKGVTDANVDRVANFLLPTPELSLSKASLRSLNAADKKAMHYQMQASLKELMRHMMQLFLTKDASQIEVNPLAVTDTNELLCVDAKLNFDDNAIFRQQKLFAEEDTSCRDARELEAEKTGLNFVSLDGNIGCLVNGAGLAMATMDIIGLNGGKPANFLDVGGGADKDQVKKSFEIIQSDKNVKAIFVNIFGGITRGDQIAQGIVDAAKEIGIKLPLVVRIVGNRAKEAADILGSPDVKKLGLNITSENDFATAARKVCSTVQ